MAIANHWQTFVQMLAERMLNSIAEGIVIALLSWLLLYALRRQNSSTRFAMLFSALATVAALPVFEGVRTNTGTVAAAYAAFRFSSFLAVGIFVVWAVIASVGLAKIGFGFWQLRKLRRSCLAVDIGLDPALHSTIRHVLNQSVAGRRVALYTSAQVRVPTAIGFLNPAIVLPPWAIEELTPVELNAVLLHELAHLRRWDDWTNLVHRIIRAVLFFHPAVWWIGHGLAREREMACDDFVLAATSNRRAYAECLVSVAEKSFLRRGLALTQALVERVQLTAQRVARILERPEAGRTVSTSTKIWKPALGLATAFSAVCLIGLPHTPRLVAFDGQVATPSTYRSGVPAVLSEELPNMHTSTMHASNGEVDLEAKTNLEAKMIPAAFVNHIFNTGARKKNVARPVMRQNRNKAEQNKNSNPAVVADALSAKLLQPQSISARLLDKNTDSAGSIGEANSVLVVMRTEQVDEYGRVWSICMWQLTVFHPVDRSLDREVRKGITPKSI